MSSFSSGKNANMRDELASIICEVFILLAAVLFLIMMDSGNFFISEFTIGFNRGSVKLTIPHSDILLMLLLLAIILRGWMFKKGMVKFIILGRSASYLLLFFFFATPLILLNNYIAYVTFGFSNFHDLALYNQAMFNFAHGRGFADPIWGGNLFGDHSELILIPLSIIYIFWQSPLHLLYLQAITVLGGGAALYFLARQKLKSDWLALIVFLAYFTSPIILNISVWTEFRPIVFAIPILFTAFYFYEKDSKYAFLVLMLLAALVKEEVPLVVATTGLYIIFFNPKMKINRVIGVILFLSGIAIFFFMIKVFIPYFGKAPYPHFVRMIGGESIFIALLKDPLLLFKSDEFFSSVKIKYFLDHFFRTGFISLFSISFIIPFSNWMQSVLTPDASVVNQQWHNVLIVIFLFISLVFGIFNFKRINKPLAYSAISFLVFTVIVYGSLSFKNNVITPLASRGVLNNTFRSEKYNNLLTAIKLIPKDSSVYTTFKILPYVSSRQNVYWYPKLEDWKDAEYILFAPETFLNDTERNKISELLALNSFAKVKDIGEFQVWKQI